VSEQKAFHEMADAIYEMHRLLKRVKQIHRFIADPNEAKKEIRRECIDSLKSASEKAKRFMDAWLLEMEKNLSL